MIMPAAVGAIGRDSPSAEDRDIKPVGTGTWSLPPLPHAEPNFLKLARGG